MSESGWQNMHYAPKDGREILVLTWAGKRRVAYWDARRDEWRSPSGAASAYKPRLWHELPAKP